MLTVVINGEAALIKKMSSVTGNSSADLAANLNALAQNPDASFMLMSGVFKSTEISADDIKNGIPSEMLDRHCVLVGEFFNGDEG